MAQEINQVNNPFKAIELARERFELEGYDFEWLADDHIDGAFLVFALPPEGRLRAFFVHLGIPKTHEIENPFLVGLSLLGRIQESVEARRIAG